MPECPALKSGAFWHVLVNQRNLLKNSLKGDGNSNPPCPPLVKGGLTDFERLLRFARNDTSVIAFALHEAENFSNRESICSL